MGAYFKSWKRKLGIVTLVMACLVAVAMVRSFSRSDSIFAENVHFMSFRGRLFVQIFLTPFRAGLSYHSQDNRGFVDAYADPHIQSLWTWRRWNFAFEHDNPIIKIMFPYWSIVLLLILLSTWLLLAKRNQPTKGKPPQEPAA